MRFALAVQQLKYDLPKGGSGGYKAGGTCLFSLRKNVAVALTC